MAPPPPVDHLVVLAHPDPESFCAAIARRWLDRVGRNHQTCGLRDLYADGFDPVLKANEQPGKPGFAPSLENMAEARRLERLDVLVFVFPVWFGTPPAMLKGYLERVVGSGIAFAPDGSQARPLSEVRLVHIVTSAASEPWLAEKGVRGALQTIYGQYIAEVFGARALYHLHLDSVAQGMGERHALEQLARVDALADNVCAEANADRWTRARTGPGPGQRQSGGGAPE